MREMLTHGSQWPTEPIAEEVRVADLIEALKFGNHKGATSHDPTGITPKISVGRRQATDMPSPSPPRKNKENTWHLHGTPEYSTAVDNK